MELPEGAIGIWYADQYQSSPRKAIPNAASAAAMSQNLLKMPRRRFNNNDFYIKNGATVTDGAAESTIALNAGDCFVYAYPHPVLPAGTFTIVVEAKRSGGSDQSFRMSFLHAGLDSGTFTATADYQTFTFTGTVSAGTQGILFVRTVGGSASSLVVRRVGLYAGSSDPGEPELSGHLYLGESHYDTRPVCGSGLMDFTTSGAFGTAQFGDSQTLSAYTVIAIGERTNDAASFSAMLGVIGHTGFCPMFDSNKTARAFFGGQDLYIGSAQSPQGLKMFGSGYRAIGHRFGSRRDLWVNDTRLISAPTSGESLPATTRDLIFGAFSSISNTGGWKWNSIVLWDRALSDDEYRTAYEVLAARALDSGYGVNTSSRFYLAVGDSITNATDSYAHLYAANANPKVFGALMASAGGTLTNLNSNAAIVDATIPPDPGANKYILSVMIGVNDLTGTKTVETYLAELEAYINARLAAGWTDIALHTLTPTNNPTYQAKRGAANVGIRALAADHVHIVDVAANADIGDDADASDVAKYPDGVHPSASTQSVIETIHRAVVDAI